MNFGYWNDSSKNNCVVLSLKFLLQLPLSQRNHCFYNTIFNHVRFIRNANILKSQWHQNYLTPAYPLRNKSKLCCFLSLLELSRGLRGDSGMLVNSWLSGVKKAWAVTLTSCYSCYGQFHAASMTTTGLRVSKRGTITLRYGGCHHM